MRIIKPSSVKYVAVETKQQHGFIPKDFIIADSMLHDDITDDVALYDAKVRLWHQPNEKIPYISSSDGHIWHYECQKACSCDYYEACKVLVIPKDIVSSVIMLEDLSNFAEYDWINRSYEEAKLQSLKLIEKERARIKADNIAALPAMIAEHKRKKALDLGKAVWDNKVFHFSHKYGFANKYADEHCDEMSDESAYELLDAYKVEYK